MESYFLPNQQLSGGPDYGQAALAHRWKAAAAAAKHAYLILTSCQPVGHLPAL